MFFKGSNNVLLRFIKEKIQTIAMTFRCKTDIFRYVAAGRAELGRDGASAFSSIEP
jgi:hypothetical protein